MPCAMNAHRLALAALAAALLALAIASCGKSPACSPTSCPTGCCDDKDMCLLGTSPSACGTAGAKCMACASALTCALETRTCVAGGSGGGGGGPAPCSTSCVGCCDAAGMCKLGDS